MNDEVLKYKNLNYWSCIIVLSVVLFLLQHGLVFRLHLLEARYFLFDFRAVEEIELDSIV
jgi:hypothetical protein